MLRKIMILSAIFLALLAGAYLFLNKPLPKGRSGPEADALAKKVWQAIHQKTWNEMGAIRWVFWGQNRHVWDRKRWLAQVSWGKAPHETTITLSLLEPHKGIAKQGGVEIVGKARKRLLQKAYAEWCNDSYWLNPMEKFFEKSVTRSIVEKDGKKMLLISFSSGGVTPGDSYLYELDAQGLPIRWQMWVSVIPVGGVAATFEGWRALANGAKVSTLHKLPFVALTLDQIQGAKDIKALVGHDPFQRLLQRFPTIRTQP